ncbi:hypothetical protein OOT46_28325 [Aquabacterium sp. A7-Y]|uniref:hypothetical protein n=1 Tax=Aquabacterium sp. A7-Y TaxID=1349605 RepID=UPI00223D575F|nr:hypothetical protein [Aquabacterium sp. A7-Y]MCW7541708.1 hypothetical protein [Aquabacterium sp. A7-Y]
MTAIVSGQGLGVSNSSLGLIGAGGQVGQAAQGRSGEQVYVNAGTGNLVVQQRDEWLVSAGPDAAILRTYNSLGALDDDNGDNWRLGLSRRISGLTGTVNTAGSTVRRIGEDGAEALYTYDAARAAYVTTEGGGAHDTLAWNGTSWTWTDGDSQVREVYEVVDLAEIGEARLKSVTDLDGKALTLGYNASGLVSQIQTASGETVYIDYDTTTGKTANIAQIRTVKTDGSLTRVRYGYDSVNRLTSVTVDLSPSDNAIADGATYVTTYTYVDATSRRLNTLTQSDGSKLDFDYDTSGRVSAVKETVGSEVRVTSFDYSTAGVTKVTDALGQVTEVAYWTSNRLLKSIKAPAVGAVNLVTTFGYDLEGNVISAANPRGSTYATTYGYDANGNRTYERDPIGNVIERSYGSRNELLSETRYRQPDPDGAGALLPSDPVTTHYVYDGQLHLRFVVNADGRVTEHQYNSHGRRASTLQHASLYSGATTLADLQAWTPGLNKSAGQRTDYAYDFRDQISTVTTYTALISKR